MACLTASQSAKGFLFLGMGYSFFEELMAKRISPPPGTNFTIYENTHERTELEQPSAFDRMKQASKVASTNSGDEKRFPNRATQALLASVNNMDLVGIISM